MKNIRILVKGLMNRDWEDSFSGFSLAYTPAGETVFSGPIKSQAELRGLVTRIADLGVEIISLETVPFSVGGAVTGSGQTGTKNKPPRGRNKETHKEGTMKHKLYLVPAALVLVITSVISGIIYSRTGDTEQSTPLAVENPVRPGGQEWTADQVKTLYGLTEPNTAPAQMSADQIKALYGFTEPKAAEPLTAEQIKALYGYIEPNAGPAPDQMTVSQIKTLYGYTEPNAGTDQMSVDQLKALYGYTEPMATAGQMSVDQIKALYGYVEAAAVPRAIEVNVRPVAAPMTPVDQIKALYGWTDIAETARVSTDITLAPLTVDQVKALYGWTDTAAAAVVNAESTPAALTADQIKALYGWTDEPQVSQTISQSAGSDELTMDQIKALYGYVEGPQQNIWDLEIVPPIYTYPWYIRP